MKKLTIEKMENVIYANMEEVRQMVLGKDKTGVNRIAKHMPELMKYVNRRTSGKKAEVELFMKMSNVFKNRVARIYG